MNQQASTTESRVTAVNGNIVAIEVADGIIVKNEVAYVLLILSLHP